jgi:hypothetical protein
MVKVWAHPHSIHEDMIGKLDNCQTFGSEFGKMFEPFHRQHQKLGIMWDVLHELDAWSKDNLTEQVGRSLDAFSHDASYNFAAPKVSIHVHESKELAKALERMMNAAIVHVVYAMGCELVKSDDL